MKANYEEDKVIVSATEPTGLDRKKVWIKKGKNLIKQIILNSMCDSNGLIYNNQPNFARTDYIPIEHNVDYIFSHSLGSGTGYISTFDKNFNYLGKINAEEITTKFNISDINVKYIIISIWSLTIEEDINIMLEQNSTATDYEPYIEKEIYVKNDNGVFERFLKYDDIPQKSGEVSLGNGTYYEKYGKVVSVYGQSIGGVTLTSDYLELGILPVGARPSRQTLGIWTTIGINTSGLVVIETTGSVKIFGGTTNSNYWGFNITFIAD